MIKRNKSVGFIEKFSLEDKDERKRYLLSLPGSAGAFPAIITAGYKMKEQILKHDPDAIIHYAGVSSGSGAALFLARNVSLEKARKYYQKYIDMHDTIYKSKTSLLRWTNYMKNIFTEVAGNDISDLNDKFYIGVTELTFDKGPQCRVISYYSSTEDLVKTILCSCHLVGFRFTPYSYHNDKYLCDGGYTCNELELPGYINVVIRNKNLDITVWDRWLHLEIDKWDRMKSVGLNYSKSFRKTITETPNNFPHKLNKWFEIRWKSIKYALIIIGIYKSIPRITTIIKHLFWKFIEHLKRLWFILKYNPL